MNEAARPTSRRRRRRRRSTRASRENAAGRAGPGEEVQLLASATARSCSASSTFRASPASSYEYLRDAAARLQGAARARRHRRQHDLGEHRRSPRQDIEALADYLAGLRDWALGGFRLRAGPARPISSRST